MIAATVDDNDEEREESLLDRPDGLTPPRLIKLSFKDSNSYDDIVQSVRSDKAL